MSVLEEMDEVMCYAKNQNLGCTILCTLDGEVHSGLPDLLVRAKLPTTSGGRDGGAAELLSLILQFKGEARKDEAAKTATGRTLWMSAINNHDRFGRWAFIEMSDPPEAKNTSRAKP